MKKIISVITAAAMALSLTACDKADNDSENNSDIGGENFSSASTNESTNSTEQSSPDVPSTGANPIMLTKNKKIRNSDWECSCETEDGVYYFQRAQSKSIGSFYYIMYIDYATGQETYLCSDSSCNHDTDRCSSYLSNREFFSDYNMRLFEYRDKLYFLNIGTILDESRAQMGGSPYEEHCRSSLYRMGLDGSNRELVYTFDKEISVQPFAAGNGNALWFFVKTPTVDYDEDRHTYFFGTKEPTMIKLDLSDRNIVEQIPLYKFGDLENISIVDCLDEKVIFWGSKLPEGVTRQDINALRDLENPLLNYDKVQELTKNTNGIYFTLNLNNKEIEEIYRYDYEKENIDFEFTDGEYVYLTDTEKQTTVRIDLKSGEKSEFYPSDGYIAIGMADGKFECRSVDKDDQTVYFIDKESGEITSNALRSTFSDEDDDYSMCDDAVAFGKDCVLIRSSHGPGFMEYYYSIMSLDDYFNGRENYKEVNTAAVRGKNGRIEVQ